MNKYLQLFFQFNRRQDPVIFWSTAFSLTGVVVMLAFFAFTYDLLPNQLPLFYSLSWGENQLVPISEAFILPFLTIILILTNLLVSWHLHHSQQVLKRMLALFSASLSLLLTLAAIRIIQLFL